jgi:hypothetical protein
LAGFDGGAAGLSMNSRTVEWPALTGGAACFGPCWKNINQVRRAIAAAE